LCFVNIIRAAQTLAVEFYVKAVNSISETLQMIHNASGSCALSRSKSYRRQKRPSFHRTHRRRHRNLFVACSLTTVPFPFEKLQNV